MQHAPTQTPPPPASARQRCPLPLGRQNTIGVQLLFPADGHRIPGASVLSLGPRHLCSFTLSFSVSLAPLLTLLIGLLVFAQEHSCRRESCLCLSSLFHFGSQQGVTIFLLSVNKN